MKEDVASFGTAGSLWGVVSRPPSSASTEWGAVLLNAGLLHRVGPHRWYVQLSRALADLGFAALRFDRSGVGDSPAQKGGDRFERLAVDETRQAMHWLADRHGCRRFALLGMCTGAEIAFKTACQDERVGATVLINAPRYLEEPDQAFRAQTFSRFRARRRWRIMLTGATRRRFRIGGVVASPRARATWRNLLVSMLGRRAAAPAGDVAHIREMLARDVRMLLLLAESDWTLEYAHAIFASATDGRTAGPGMAHANPRLETIRGADHTLTALADQDVALDLITGWARDLVSRAGGRS